ncbi:hypothetical protein ACFYNO_35355 [Kitasatospora sp. NPDC006697]|uniref:hypothetical protein n=1 Tax=Kitasatospora sp. NPDC006697 TaxID=3364020 RepID=UPI0036A81A6A
MAVALVATAVLGAYLLNHRASADTFGIDRDRDDITILTAAYRPAAADSAGRRAGGG